MKKIKELTKEEFESLEQSNLLLEIFPNASKVYEDNFVDRPSIKKDIDWTSVIKQCEEILDYIEKEQYSNEDDPTYLYESVMTTLYGENIFKYIRFMTN